MLLCLLPVFHDILKTAPRRTRSVCYPTACRDVERAGGGGKIARILWECIVSPRIASQDINVGQTCALMESIVPDGGDGIGDDDARQT